MNKFIAGLLAISVTFSGCTFTEVASNPAGAKTHVNTTGIGLKLFFSETLAGSPTIDHALDACADEAKQQGADKLTVVQSNSSNLWWLLFPLTVAVNPVITNVAADAN